MALKWPATLDELEEAGYGYTGTGEDLLVRYADPVVCYAGAVPDAAVGAERFSAHPHHAVCDRVKEFRAAEKVCSSRRCEEAKTGEPVLKRDSGAEIPRKGRRRTAFGSWEDARPPKPIRSRIERVVAVRPPVQSSAPINSLVSRKGLRRHQVL